MQLPPQKKYIKKLLVLRQNKDGTNKLELADEIPRRWKEQWRDEQKASRRNSEALNAITSGGGHTLDSVEGSP